MSMNDFMSDRDDANLKQFRSRAQQPKVALPAKKSSVANPAPTAVNIYVVHNESGFGTTADQIDGTRFRYLGTSPQYSAYEGMCNRRMGQQCMGTRS